MGASLISQPTRDFRKHECVQTIHALLVRHSINVMHVEKNVCESVVKTSFEEKGIVKMLKTWRHLGFGGIYILYMTLHDLEWYYSIPHHSFYQSKRTQSSCAGWHMYWCLRTIVVHCKNTWQRESCWAWKHMIGMRLCNNNCLCILRGNDEVVLSIWTHVCKGHKTPLNWTH